MSTVSRVCLLTAIAVILWGCSRSSHEVDWAQWEAAGRVAERPAGFDVLLGKAAHRWTDGSVALELVPVASLVHRGVRLATRVSGAQGHETRFLLDTGSVGSLLGMNAPLAREVVLSRIPFKTGGTHATGYVGHLPLVRMGPIEARDLTVSVVTRSDLQDAERNILGIVHLFHTQLEHRGGRWTLRSGSARLAASEPGWISARLEPGTPVLRVRGPEGRVIKALIDTGAYESFAVGASPRGRYEIPAVSGAVAHRFQIRTHKDRVIDASSFGDHEVGLIIGMDVLTSRAWRLTPDEGSWSFAPDRGPSRTGG